MVVYDSWMPLLEADGAGAGSRQEDRAGEAESVLWATQGFPVDNSDPSDAAYSQVKNEEWFTSAPTEDELELDPKARYAAMEAAPRWGIPAGYSRR